MSSNIKPILYTKQWDLEHRVLMHALIHQLALATREIAPEEPIVKEYIQFSYEAVSGYLNGDSTEECLNNIDLADEAFNVLYSVLNQSTAKDLTENPTDSGIDDSFIIRTHLALAPVILEEHLEALT